jgi:hypothetical protein
MLLIQTDKVQEQCNACHGWIDVKCIKVGIDRTFMSNIALCKSCRSLLHKRLHEEEEKEHANT